ncbi:hypothetical protein BGW80DRAFT_1290212, partial [Lactifluus volemus]
MLTTTESKLLSSYQCPYDHSKSLAAHLMGNVEKRGLAEKRNEAASNDKILREEAVDSRQFQVSAIDPPGNAVIVWSALQLLLLTTTT